MLNSIANIFELFEKISTIDKCMISFVFCVSLIFIHKLTKEIFSFIIKTGFSIDSLLKFYEKTIYLFKNYELKTIAGIINFVSSIGFILITFFLFVSPTLISNLLGVQNNHTSLYVFVVITILVTFGSMILLYFFDRIQSNTLR